MKYLHESNTDNRTLQDIINAIDSGEGYSVTGKTYASVIQHPYLLGNCIPIINTSVESYLTASEQSALQDDSFFRSSRNPVSGQLPDTFRGNFWEPMAVCARFMESLTLSDFTLANGLLDATRDTSEWTDMNVRLRDHNLGIRMSTFPTHEGIRVDPSHFVLSNIEDTSTGTIYMTEGRSGFIDAKATAWWADTFDYSGNPYHKSRNPEDAQAIKLRAFVAGCVEMIVNRNDDPDRAEYYLSRRISSWAEAYRLTRDILPPKVSEAWLEMLLELVDHLFGTHGSGQSNLSQWTDIGFASICLHSTDPSLRKYYADIWATQSETNYAYKRIGGHNIDHDGGSDYSYDGRKTHPRLAEFLLAYGAGYGGTDSVPYEFLNKLHKLHKYTLLPDGSGNGYSTNYSCATGQQIATNRGYENPQWNEECWTWFLPYFFPEARWMLYYAGFPTETYLDSQINDYWDFGFNGWNENAWGTNSTKTPDPWSNKYDSEHMNVFYEFCPSDIYDKIAQWKDTSSEDILPTDINDIKTGALAEDSFIIGSEISNKTLFAKPNQDLYVGFYGIDRGYKHSITEGIAGLYSGLDWVWTRDTGPIILSRTRGTQATTQEDTLDYIHRWCSNHIWGTLNSGDPFSTALPDRDFGNSGDSITTTANDPTDGRWQAHATLSGGRYGYNPFSGNVEFNHDFTVDSNGVVATEIITCDDQSNQITELWKSIPLVGNINGDGSLSIQIDTGSGFTSPSMDTLITGVTTIRLTRYNNSVDIIPDATEHPNGWDVEFDGTLTTRTGDVDVRILRVDLHGNNGTAIDFPSSTTVKYQVTPV